MAQRIISNAREKALVSLLEDPSPIVQEALLKEFQRLGSDGISILQKVIREGEEDSRKPASQIVGTLIGPDPSRLFFDFIRSLQYDLESGLLMINRVIFPECDREQSRDGMEKLADRCRELGVAPMNPREQCRVINRVLFHEAGFRGNTEDFDDPLNSCMEVVLKRKTGLPILLSSLYILVGQRLGLDLEPIGLPGHFMVGSFTGSEPFYIDPFEREKFRTMEDVREFLIQRQITPELHHLAPVPVGEVLCRVCRNLVRQFEARNQPRWANRFRMFVREFEQTHRRRSGA